LESVGVPSAGIALIFGVDRILDMIRTVTNITGDVVVATVVAASEGQLRDPNQVSVSN
jgi:proton glutamate symport protein